jgi:hypothetical protein
VIDTFPSNFGRKIEINERPALSYKKSSNNSLFLRRNNEIRRSDVSAKRNIRILPLKRNPQIVNLKRTPKIGW